MGGRFPLLVLSLAALCFAEDKKAVEEEDELLLVQVVVRHADRASVNGKITPNAEKVFFRGHEELSDQGIDNAHKQGSHFRKRYVDTGFIDKRMIPSQIYFQSSGIRRVLMSAKSFASGLFDKTPKGDPVLPPILTQINLAEDKMLVPDTQCPDDWDDMYEKYGIEDDGKETTRQIQVLKTMTKVPLPEDCKFLSLRELDPLISENSNDHTRPHLSEEYRKCGDDGAKWLMYKYVGMLAGAGEDYDDRRAKRTVGVLMDTMLNNLEKVANCTKDDCTDFARFRVYYTHDTNVLAIAHLFDAVKLFNGKTPAFSSAFVLELRRNSHGHYVNVIMKNGQEARFEHAEKCKNRACTLERVLKEKRPFATPTFVGCSTDSVEEDDEWNIDYVSGFVSACIAALVYFRFY